MGKSQRKKGVTGELEVAHLFQDAGFNARRGIGQWQSASLVPDVVLDDLPQYWIEVKRGAQTRPLEALDQAKKACGKKIPIAITRNDKEKHLVAMDACDWVILANLDWNISDAFGISVIMPFYIFLSAFKEKHADKCKQLSFITNRGSTTVAHTTDGSTVSNGNLSNVPDAVSSQQDLFNKPGS